MRRTGLIGRSLAHSLSPQIHEKFYEIAKLVGTYTLHETSKNMLGSLLEKLASTQYAGVNVTIPYKTEVIKHLDMVTDEALEIGAVNTIHFDYGKKVGYNTDYFGLEALLEFKAIELEDQCVAVLGTGGAARCAVTLAKHEGASEVFTVSRNPSNADAELNPIDYASLDALDQIGVLINATPVGMSPNADACPVNDDVIAKCGAVVDMIYNPEQTMLLKKARQMGKQTAGGMMMLVTQAVKAQEIWTGKVFGQQVYQDIYTFMSGNALGAKPNIALIGMPGCGKSAIGKRLAELLKMDFVDTDEIIETKYGPIPEIFANAGEDKFREFELTAVRKAASLSGTVISTGGGVILDERNMKTLKATGSIIFINRPLKHLLSDIDTSKRPLLADGKQKVLSLYTQRISLYKKYADMTADNAFSIDKCIQDIAKQWKEQT